MNFALYTFADYLKYSLLPAVIFAFLLFALIYIIFTTDANSMKCFKCNKSGTCCRHGVLLTEKDIARIERTGKKKKEFLSKKKYTRVKDRTCIFNIRKGKDLVCSIYKARPDRCRTYPFFNVFGCKFIAPTCKFCLKRNKLHSSEFFSQT
ncbi:MAG: YkgJ family cysteine cluster protein [Nanoarchaeota archaeon]|nr:YkgJ family cysteine cluster protein [Nanoarchaeota archaeon]